MKEEEPIRNTGLQSLLEALQRHGADSRRQECLSTKIDLLAAAESRRRRVIIGVAALVTLVLLLFHPATEKDTPQPAHLVVAEMVPRTNVQPTVSCVPIPIVEATSLGLTTTSAAEAAEVLQRDTLLLAKRPSSLVFSSVPVEDTTINTPHDEPPVSRVLVRESTRLVAMNPGAHRDTTSENSFFTLAMSSASREIVNPFTITF